MMFGFKPKISRDEGIFVKTMFEFKKSRANVSHKLKMHMRCAILAKLMSVC